MQTKSCPDCGDDIAFRASSCKCGWKLAPVARRSESSGDSDHLRCHWIAGGQRCCYAGGISTDTHGGGPWYCRGHFGCSDGAMGATIVEESVKALHRAPAYDPESVLERIRSFYQRGGIPKPNLSLVKNDEDRLEREAIQTE